MGHRDTPGFFAPLLLGGGIGAGKSKVLAEFERTGFVVIEADVIGHGVLESKTPSGREVMARWPQVVVDGNVDRAKLAAIVFNEPSELADLEAISHPAIWDGIDQAIAVAARESPGVRVIVEIPLLRMGAEVPWVKIAVLAPEEVRVARATSRGADAADVRARIANQEPDEAWAEWAYVVIDNRGLWEDTLKMLKPLIEGIAP